MRTDRGWRRFYAAGWLISAGVMGVTFRMWQLHVREVEQRAEEAVRTKDEAARRRAMEERLRIARELHDSLTHSISVICVQAGVAVHLARKRGDEVPPALLAIQEAGADAARELRTTLSVLRSSEDGDSSDLGQLDRLVARARAAGLPVTVTITGAQRVLPPDVAQAADGQQAVTLAAEHRPDIALMDIQMPVLDGLEATRQIVADERLADVRVVILTNFGLDEHIFRALRAGASGFLLKDTEPAELLQALRVVTRGDSLLSPAVTRRLISEFVARPPDALAAAGMESLTNREREVVALVAHGLSNDEIAEAMVLSPAPAKTHVSRAMLKLGARDAAQIVV